MSFFSRFALSGLMVSSLALTAHAEDASVIVSRAWTPVQAQPSVDTPLYMHIVNRGSEADALTRVRCPVATFTEDKLIDVGEGVPAPRSVKSIPVPASGSTDLSSTTGYVALLQTTQALPAGTSFTCTLTFRVAGPLDVSVVTGKTAP